MDNYEDMAKDIIFSKTTEDKLMAKYNVSYRSKKGAEDVKNAIRKSLKIGNGRTENEISFLGLYLSMIFKDTK